LSFSRCWQQFLAAPTLLIGDPGIRERWHQGRRWYHVSVLVLEEPAIQERRKAIFSALSPLLRPSAPATPHVTVWVHGFGPPDFSEEGAEVEVEVGRVNSFRSCVFLEVRCPEIRKLRASFSGVEERYAPYLPHITVGCYQQAVLPKTLLPLLRPFRRLPPLRLRARLQAMCVDAWDTEGGLRPARSIPPAEFTSRDGATFSR
jgi:hypothetical protein